MHPTLHRFIMGMRQDAPDFTWQPTDLHNRLAAALPAHAVYGLFRDAWQDGNVIYMIDPDDRMKAQRFLPDVAKVIDGVRIEGVNKCS